MMITKTILATLNVICICLVLVESGTAKPNGRTKQEILSSFTHKHQLLNVPKGKKLELVHLVFRHGTRTPADTYPNDPYINDTFAPNGWGQITNAGKVRLYETGMWLRSRYDAFLGKDYSPDAVHAQATGISRTHMTLATILSSLFNPKGTSMEWNKDLDWQPIPIKSEDLDKDTLLLVRINCPRYFEALKEVMDLPETQKYMNAYKGLYEDLTKMTGMHIETPEDVSSLYSTLRAEEEFGLQLPSWTDKYYPLKMQDNADYAYILNVFTDEMQKIKAGPFLSKMSNEWTLKSYNRLEPKDRKLFIYCAHDSTIVNILSALNVWIQQFPHYNIMIMFELYKDMNTWQHEVRFYLKHEGKEPIPLTLPGCDTSCPLNQFLQIIKSKIPSPTLTNECRAKDPTATTPKPSGP